MSIVLKAFPLGFLIDSNSEQKSDSYDLTFEREKLHMIKVATNLKPENVSFLMENLDIPYSFRNNKYYLNNGLCVEWKSYQGHYCAFLTQSDGKVLKKSPAEYDFTNQAEFLFKNFDVILRRNTRDVSSKEIFYYCYKTQYNSRSEILEVLKQQQIENISRCTENEIRFRYNNKNYKFKRDNSEEPFYLESEQRIPLVDIIAGRNSETTRNVRTNLTYRDVLLKTLEEHGAKSLNSDKYNIYCELSGMYFWYSKNNEQDAYNLEISKITDEDECSQLLEDLESEYGLNIQELTYRKILERIKDKNMRLEGEYVEDDNSIVLTIDLG